MGRMKRFFAKILYKTHHKWRTIGDNESIDYKTAMKAMLAFCH